MLVKGPEGLPEMNFHSNWCPRCSGSLPASQVCYINCYLVYTSSQSLGRTQQSYAYWWKYSMICYSSHLHLLGRVKEEGICLVSIWRIITSLNPRFSPGVQGHYLPHQVCSTNCHLVYISSQEFTTTYFGDRQYFLLNMFMFLLCFVLLWIYNHFLYILFIHLYIQSSGMYFHWEGHMGQVMKVRLSCYLVLLSVDSKTR